MPKEPNQPDRDQLKSSRQPERAGQHDDPTAEDRGRRSSRDFASDREADELGSELERETGIEQDDEDMDEPGRRDR